MNLVKNSNQEVLRSHFAEAFDSITQKENLTVYQYNDLMFNWGIAFLDRCKALELQFGKDFWEWWKFKYQLNDYEYMVKDALKRGQYDIWKSQMLGNPRLREEMFTYINQCNESRSK